MDGLKSNDLEEEVLRKVGRSVVNFQKLEGMLKSISWVSSYAGSIADIRDQHARHTDSLGKKSLGMVVADFFEKIYVDGDAGDPRTDAMDYALRSRISGGDRERLKALLETIVGERNELIHTRLLHFDSRSVESCNALNKFLDEQHERIAPVLEEIWMLFDGMRKARKAFLDHSKKGTDHGF